MSRKVSWFIVQRSLPYYLLYILIVIGVNFVSKELYERSHQTEKGKGLAAWDGIANTNLTITGVRDWYYKLATILIPRIRLGAAPGSRITF